MMRQSIYFLLIGLGIGIFIDYTGAQDEVPMIGDNLPMGENASKQSELLKAGHENLQKRLEIMEQHFEKQQQNQREIESKFQNLETKLDKLYDNLLNDQEKNYKQLKEILGGMHANECPQDQSEFLPGTEKTALLNEYQKLAKQQESILTKLDDKCESQGNSNGPNIKVDAEGVTSQSVHAEGINVCWGIYTKILGELNSNLTILQNIDRKLSQINDLYGKETEKQQKSIEITHGLLRFLNKKEDSKICVKSDDQKLMCTNEAHPTSCADSDSTHCSNNKCRIKNVLYGPESFFIACDDNSDGGGWTIIQRRINGSVDFYRGWSEYKAGFGNLDGEFWIGLDKLHALTTSLAPVELLIQLEDHEGVMQYAKYGRFAVGNEEELYALKEADDYEGNAGDSFSYHMGQKFSTKDKDNDSSSSYSCAVDKRGAWWYDSCQWSNLNGFYYPTGVVAKGYVGSGINWNSFHGYNYSMKSVQMMIRTKKT